MSDGGRYGLAVIGGGINGCAIANLAAFNGLSVVLIEKNSIASGTSSKSSKLLHGGLRYLENLEFDLVAEALKERTLQLKIAPALTRPLGFIVPVYKDSPRPLWMVKLGVGLYDFLSGRYCIHPHRPLTAQEVLYFAPDLKPDGLIGGVMYYDAQMDDAGLCRANAESARRQGAEILEHARAASFIFENGKAVGVNVEDARTGATRKVLADHVVVAAGPWNNSVMDLDASRPANRVRATKGAHFIYSRRFCEHALVLQTKDGGRIFFVMPWGNETLIGTTDTDYNDDPDGVKAEADDVNYLFSELGRFFPLHNFSPESVISTFAGLRPLVHQKGSPSKVSRKHVIETSATGIVYVMGGKYTTYRLIAQDALKKCLNRALKNTDNEYPLLGLRENTA